jgi:hypothetical protein
LVKISPMPGNNTSLKLAWSIKYSAKIMNIPPANNEIL